MAPNFSKLPLGDFENWTTPHVARLHESRVPHKTFITELNGHTETYGEFIGKARSLASFLAKIGVRKGDHVAIFCKSTIAALHGWLAANLLGAVDASINSNLLGDPLKHVLSTARPRVILTEQECLRDLQNAYGGLDGLPVILVDGALPAPDPSIDFIFYSYKDALDEAPLDWDKVHVTPLDPCAVMFTSGTTGPSKAVLMPYGQVCMLAQQVILNTRLCAEDVFLCVHPLNHIAGKFMGVFASFVAGASIVLDKRFEAATWLETVREFDVTISIAHGPMIEMINQRPRTPFDDGHSLKRLMCCPIPKSLGSAFEERFGLKGIEMWGMTEITCPCWTSLDGTREIGSCGVAMTEWFDVEITDPDTGKFLPNGKVGELVVRPKHPGTMMLQYLNDAEATVKVWRDLWFHTGDAAWRDERGNFFIVDRLHDRIRRRSENISSFDIEQAALSHPGIREAAAVGVPSGMESDDDIKLCIVADAGETPENVLRYLADRLPHFMMPRYIEMRESLPRTSTNKVRKRELRESGISEETWDRQASGIRLKDLYRSAQPK
ncbi:AMP-binding protein [Agrobacterium genomosp. 3 str. CIP 111-78]|uniref:ATP-dependent acyl-CoA ligase n=1 Tax=Agrobacterium tumefaciens TaxID=358 RepID=A0AAE6EMY6_AGRTU|nr:MULTISPECIES: AMP-binding protein [Agrobacterium tumefaciens complex]MCA2371099.1 AMP-binding protein [Agrobacterium tomkonis CIP 111-78]QCM03603.1 ATP-dependent acyl-CoA ligase [Agrobacterium tumefaciens]